MFSKEIKSEYLKEIADSENIKLQIRHTECVYIARDLITIDCVPSDASDGNYLFLRILQAFIKLSIYFILFLPYFIQLIPFILFIYSFNTGNYLLILITFINTIFSLFSILGALGKFVGGCCCGCFCKCLYHPSNWVLLVVLIDLVCLILDIIITILGTNGLEENFVLDILHIPAILYYLFRQIKLYIEFKKAYKKIRKVETDIIKECINELLKEGNYYNK